MPRWNHASNSNPMPWATSYRSNGERAPANIGPHAALVFELELLEVHQEG
ncbi:MAG: hypothetical protein LAT61_09355 [Alcanivorax sp.]|nr:hypothetical protein [Alcanivorax sp.]